MCDLITSLAVLALSALVWSLICLMVPPIVWARVGGADIPDTALIVSLALCGAAILLHVAAAAFLLRRRVRGQKLSRNGRSGDIF